jgi:hypothetical protein
MCGSGRAAQAWSADGDRLAIEDMTEQAKRANPALARILRILREQLRVEASIADTIERGLRRTYRDAVGALTDELGRVPGSSISARAARLGLNVDVLGQLLEASGLGSVRDEVAVQQSRLVELTLEQMDASGLPVRSPPLTAIEAAARELDRQFWGETVVTPRAEDMWDGLRTSILAEPLEDVAARIAERAEQSIPQALTEARTQVAEFDRTVTAVAAEAADAELFAYLGPVDGITRPFCAELAGLVLTREQVGRLDNAQTATSPLVSGGGYNCRHSFNPTSPALVDVLGMELATDAQVKAANARARGGRR